jgi:hypothetical protein
VDGGAGYEGNGAILVDDIVIRPDGDGKGSKSSKRSKGGAGYVPERKPKSVRVRAPDILADMARGRPPFVGLSDEQLDRLRADNALHDDNDDEGGAEGDTERGGLLHISYPVEGVEEEKYTRKAKR